MGEGVGVVSGGVELHGAVVEVVLVPVGGKREKGRAERGKEGKTERIGRSRITTEAFALLYNSCNG